MRVAAMISGLPRFSSEFDTFFENVSGYEEIDWFFYMWNLSPVPRFDECDAHASPSWKFLNQDQMIDKIASNLTNNQNIVFFKLCSMPPYNPVREPIPNAYTYANGVYFNYLGQKLVSEARQEYENKNGEYDLVIRTRPDCGIKPYLNLYEVKNFLNSNPNAIITPANYRNGVQGRVVNADFAVGTSKIMTTYCNMFDHMYNYETQGVIFHPETLLAHHLHINSITTPMTNFDIVFREFKTPNGKPVWGKWA
jgi:hypothetical protein